MPFIVLGGIIVVFLLWLATIFLKLVNAPCYARDIDWIVLLLPIIIPVVLGGLAAIGATFFFLIFQLI